MDFVLFRKGEGEMEEDRFPQVNGGCWALTVRLGGVSVSLVQESYLDDPSHAAIVLRTVGTNVTDNNLDRFFPHRDGRGRCPTLEIMNMLESWYHGAKEHKYRVGV